MESERAPQERIDDPAKAEHMAYASDERNPKYIEMLQNNAGIQYEIRQRVRALTDEELLSSHAENSKKLKEEIGPDINEPTIETRTESIELEREGIKRGIIKDQYYHDRLIHGDDEVWHS